MFGGGPWLNVLSLLVSTVGSVVGILAYVIAIRQIRETRDAAVRAAKAADAANQAVQSVQSKVGQFGAFTGATNVAAISANVCTSMQSDRFATASERIVDLRRAVAEIRSNAVLSGLVVGLDWDKIINELRGLQELLVRQARGEVIAKKKLSDATTRMLEIDAILNDLRAAAAAKVGADQWRSPQS